MRWIILCTALLVGCQSTLVPESGVRVTEYVTDIQGGGGLLTGASPVSGTGQLVGCQVIFQGDLPTVVIVYRGERCFLQTFPVVSGTES